MPETTPWIASAVTDEVRLAFESLRALIPEQRSWVLCWFCLTCCKYIGPGESFCHVPMVIDFYDAPRANVSPANAIKLLRGSK